MYYCEKYCTTENNASDFDSNQASYIKDESNLSGNLPYMGAGLAQAV
jgi:hypothetical protein